MAKSTMDFDEALTEVTASTRDRIEKARFKNGRLVQIPTVYDAYERHLRGKWWWWPRDELIRMHVKMLRMQSPFRNDKDKLQEGGISRMSSGDKIFAVDSFPFDALSQSISALAKRHPYVTAYPSLKGQSTGDIENFQKFWQAVFDTRFQEAPLLRQALANQVASGWLIADFTYDPMVKAQGDFPYDLRWIFPVGFYPRFDARGKILYATIERQVSGAELKQNYGHFPGVADLFTFDDDALKDTDAERRYKIALDNSLFTLIRYYDDCVTCLMVLGSDIDPGLVTMEPGIRKLRDQSLKGNPSSVLDKNDTDDPWRGVYEHNMGRIPFEVAFCWPEVGADGWLDPDQMSGRFMGLPFFFSQYENWRNISRLLGQLHTIMLKASKPKLVTTSATARLEGDVVRVEPGEDMRYEPFPGMPKEGIMLFEKIEEQVQRGTMAMSAYGAPNSNSGIANEKSIVQGSLRVDSLETEIERVLGLYVRGATDMARHRGKESYTAAAGKAGSRRYGGSYVAEIDLSKFQKAPQVTVELMNVNGLKNDKAVAEFRSLVGELPTRYLLKNILDEANPDEVIKEMRDEAAMKHQDAIQPYIDLQALNSRLDTAEDLAKKGYEADELEEKWKVWRQKQELMDEVEEMPEEAKLKNFQQFVLMMAQKEGLDVNQIAAEIGATPPSANMPSPQSPGLPGPGGPMGMMPQPQSPMLPPRPGLPMPNGPMPMPPRPGGPPMMTGPMPPNQFMQPRPPLIGTPPLPPGPLPAGGPGGPVPGGTGIPARMAPAMPQGPAGPVNPPGSSLTPMHPGTAPGQADRAIQPLSSYQPAGGIGRPGVAPGMRGPQQGQVHPVLATANEQVKPIAPLAVKGGDYRNPAGKKTHRGKRGGKR